MPGFTLKQSGHSFLKECMNRKESKPKCVFLIKYKGKPYRYMVRINKEYVGCFKTEAEAETGMKRFLERKKRK